jgi:hypothetical protein
MAGTWASEAPPFFERLCPAMTMERLTGEVSQDHSGLKFIATPLMQ